VKTVKQNEDGSFSLDMDYFCFHYATDRMYTPKLVELFGEPRPRETPFSRSRRVSRNILAKSRRLILHNAG